MTDGNRKDRTAGWPAAPTAARAVTLLAEGPLTVTAQLRPEGDLEIFGRDEDAGRFHGEPGEEYEYALGVAPADVGAVLAGLGADPGADVLSVLADRGEQIVRRGERRWLREHGVEATFFSRRGGMR